MESPDDELDMRVLTQRAVQLLLLQNESAWMKLLKRFKKVTLSLVMKPETHSAASTYASRCAQEMVDDGLVDVLDTLIRDLAPILKELSAKELDFADLEKLVERLMVLKERYKPVVDRVEKFSSGAKELINLN